MRVWGEIDSQRTLRVYARFVEALSEFPRGERLRITIDRDRNGKYSAMYHLMLDLLAKAINRGPAATSLDDLKKWIKLKRGWFEVVPLPAPHEGVTHAIQFKSTAFDAMGEDEFQRFATESAELIAAEIAPWIKGAPEYADVMALIKQINPEVGA
jgi:hypothetical protein